MSEQIAQVGDLEIAYETFGDPSDPPLLLIMGLGMQMTGWDPDFCRLLADEGFHVIRYDNRDVGHSTKIDDGRRLRMSRVLAGHRGSASYTLEDLAGDAVGLLGALGIERAHLVGVSMGGMIAQLAAIRFPERVLTLTSIMSGPGDRWTRLPRLRVLGVLLKRAPSQRERYVEHVVGVVRKIGSPDYPTDEAKLRERAAQSFDRSYYPVGAGRHMHAVTATPSRRRDLEKLQVPTLVIHGAEDPLAPPRGGRATAKAIPDAELMEIEGMGHDLPRQLWPRLVEAIARNAQRARARSTVTAE